jgi:hypothetical protein
MVGTCTPFMYFQILSYLFGDAVAISRSCVYKQYIIYYMRTSILVKE